MVECCQLLSGGFTNRNLLLRFAEPHSPLVLRVYQRGADAGRKEIDLLRYLAGKVPVPEIVAADDAGAWVVYRYIEGITFQELKHRGNNEHVAEASYAIGQALAKIHAIPPPSDLNLRPSPGHPRLRDALSLVHGDFNNRNTIVSEEAGHWTVAAILDWESAFIGSPLWDAARFTCYENPERPLREPHFSEGYRKAGGALPQDWPAFSRQLSAISAAESLARPDLPPQFIPELCELAGFR